MTATAKAQTAPDAIAPFNFQGNTVRIITKADGSVWFVAADVAKVLGFVDTDQAIRAHCKQPELFKPVDITGMELPPRGRFFIPESDLYRLIIRSTKPEAQQFERWVMEDVLPTLRKTGTYTMPSPKASPPAPNVASPKFAKEVSQLHREFVRTAKTFGLSPEQAALSASQAVRKLYGVDFVEMLAIPGVESPSQERHLTPTQIGESRGISGREINQMLQRQGYQYKDEFGNWTPTTSGKKLSVLVDTTKRHRNGTPVQQLRWLSSIMTVLYFGDDIF